MRLTRDAPPSEGGGGRPEELSELDLRAVPLLGMSIAVSDGELRVAQVRLYGDLCLMSAPQLAHTLRSLTEQGVAVIRLNLVGLDLCTAAGIRTLVKGRQRLEARGGRLEIVGAQGVVQRVLELAGDLTPS